MLSSIESLAFGKFKYLHNAIFKILNVINLKKLIHKKYGLDETDILAERNKLSDRKLEAIVHIFCSFIILDEVILFDYNTAKLQHL